MAIAVEMPKPGNTVEECLLAKWVKTAGSHIHAGEIIAEIETDKATFEVQSPAEGVLLATFYDEGALAPVYSNICVIGEPGEDVSSFAPGPKTEVGQAFEPAGPLSSGRTEIPEPTPASSHRPSPRARRYAAERGIHTGGIQGSGPGGRILEADVRAHYHSSPKTSALARAKAAESGIQLSRTREKIAQRMRESLAGTAQYTLTASAGATGLLTVRARIKARGRESGLPDININELVLFCTVQALLKMPALNAELRDGKLYQHHHVHLGFACDTDRGLLVPVIRDAHSMTMAELSAAAKSLAERAISGSISPDDLTGATFTVSNLGSLGIESFTPILNPPQIAILGVNAIQVRAIRTPRGIELADRIGLSLTCDHQVIDGAPGARFLGVVGECIEQVETFGV